MIMCLYTFVDSVLFYREAVGGVAGVFLAGSQIGRGKLLLVGRVGILLAFQANGHMFGIFHPMLA